ncbi:MAG: hypothetical protein EO766_17395 [Hydrotalea sp. AMD]|uniref:hypothetical protein n=1 Tax=Hydrotalea sp. AMD TaxID=2501297 RepID=UPI0010250975|nr:hypothetical protein [Hydrotalea sp. AMD]RWZ84314.1 MAG: hypothetical protein EO766_17395 [Hydrotalea sp. AMD]
MFKAVAVLVLTLCTIENSAQATREKDMHLEVAKLSHRLQHMPDRKLQIVEYIGYCVRSAPNQERAGFRAKVLELNREKTEWVEVGPLKEIYWEGDRNTWAAQQDSAFAGTHPEFAKIKGNKEELNTRLSELARNLAAYRELKRRAPRPESPLMTETDKEYANFEAIQ